MKLDNMTNEEMLADIEMYLEGIQAVLEETEYELASDPDRAFLVDTLKWIKRAYKATQA